MLKKHLLIVFMVVGLFKMNAQELLSPSLSFSHKKISYITLKDGTELKGNIKDIDRKKGLIKYVKLKDADGKKHKMNAEDIAHMYLPPSGIDNLAKKLDFLHDAQKWTDEKLDQDLLTTGYVYFENSDVKIKKKTRELLMQLLNPTYSGKVKIYHDPLAKETMGLGIGGIKVAGGHAKSYFLKIGKDVAYKVKKKNYKDEFKPLWKKCKAVRKNNPKVKWSELTKHVMEYTECES